MVHYGHFSPKPHLGLSNSKWIGRFNCGPLRGWKAHMNQERKTTVVYSRDGKKKWHGSKHLKSTQSTPQLNVLWVAYCTHYVNCNLNLFLPLHPATSGLTRWGLDIELVIWCHASWPTVWWCNIAPMTKLAKAFFSLWNFSGIMILRCVGTVTSWKWSFTYVVGCLWTSLLTGGTYYQFPFHEHCNSCDDTN